MGVAPFGERVQSPAQNPTQHPLLSQLWVCQLGTRAESRCHWCTALRDQTRRISFYGGRNGAWPIYSGVDEPTLHWFAVIACRICVRSISSSRSRLLHDCDPPTKKPSTSCLEGRQIGRTLSVNLTGRASLRRATFDCRFVVSALKSLWRTTLTTLMSSKALCAAVLLCFPTATLIEFAWIGMGPRWVHKALVTTHSLSIRVPIHPGMSLIMPNMEKCSSTVHGQVPTSAGGPFLCYIPRPTLQWLHILKPT